MPEREILFPRPGHKAIAARHFLDCDVRKQLHSTFTALLFEHVENVLSGVIAKKLSQSFLVVRDAVLLNQRDEIRRGIACQCRFGEMRIGGNKVVRANSGDS